MAMCRSCERLIIWAETVNGKAMPIDEQPSDKGNLVYLHGKVRSVTEEDRRLHRQLYTSHFATCPDANSHRRAR